MRQQGTVQRIHAENVADHTNKRHLDNDLEEQANEGSNGMSNVQHRVGLLTSFKGVEENGIHMKPVLKQASHQTPLTALVAQELGKAQQPKSGSTQGQKRAKHQNITASASSKPPKTALEKAHHRLSFGEELEEEEATPSAAFSLALSTANRFHEERRHWVPGSSALPSAAVETVVARGGQEKVKRLGPIACGYSQTRGPRPYMEDRLTFIADFTPTSFSSQAIPDGVDRSFAAVYDGHNGAASAEYACSRLHTLLAQEPAMRECRGEVSSSALPWVNQGGASKEVQEAEAMRGALKHAFHLLDTEILDRARAEQGRDGATALIVLRIGQVIWAAHAGDSRAVLSRSGSSLCLTQDHKPELAVEKARVEENGGRVEFQRCWRVICPATGGRPASGLAVSRSLGDLDFKEPSRFVSAEPDVSRLQLMPLQDEFVILASDGLWDVISSKEACEIVKENLSLSRWKTESKARLDVIAKQAADVLVQRAIVKKSMDNITALVLLFQWH